MNLEKIAELSGVSRSTVSRVINNDPRVHVETRERVQQIIHKLHYQPNAAARSLASGHTHILGLAAPTGVSSVFSDPYFPNLIRGISSACQKREYTVMMWLAEPEYERRTVQQVLTTSYLDGAIISSMPVDEAMVRIVIDSRLPLVLVGRDPANSEVSYVDVENKHGAMEAVLHLARLGRKRIATLTGPLNTVVGVDRRDGYLDALQIRGLPAIPELMAEGNFSQEDGYSLMQKLIPYQPDALFAASDAMALGAMRAMRQAGLRVPDDVAVVGFDDLPFSLTTDPPLTTIRQPICQTGAMAVDMLIDMIEHPEEPQPRRIVLPVELVIRRSCGTIK